MRFQSRATVPTAHASRYIQQLCKHWSHSLAVEFDADQGRIVFPRDLRGADWPDAATLLLQARPEGLEYTLAASAEGQLAALKGTVERHLDRFAFREAPLAFAWKDAA
ncbi:hypothetical protein CR162_08825 [Pseudoroseomonas rhizosphaerae]|uniref:2,4-dihydroxyhept-2-ene-1,7-dioic acid aldolase n=1 Tax=Teichococcus rhizosphaerae TaxID=1335062 RepID=A0A2C7ADV6_9PROT|nr:DUF2218 domain-containing protein [Pseudoroseomonas rhizosphaerae]PHK95264.1 hypothetical protein CR162_08825 [Pseudoroseomonas rhizosphaerae]